MTQVYGSFFEIAKNNFQFFSTAAIQQKYKPQKIYTLNFATNCTPGIALINTMGLNIRSTCYTFKQAAAQVVQTYKK